MTKSISMNTYLHGVFKQCRLDARYCGGNFRNLKGGIATLVLMVAAFGVVAPAGATEVEARGLNTAGTDYRIACPAGAYVVGFQARTGDWVDSLRIVCAAWDEKTRSVGRPTVIDAAAGASTGGGQDQVLNCPGFQAVKSVAFGLLRSDEHYLDNLLSACALMEPPYSPGASSSLQTNDQVEPSGIGVGNDPAPSAVVACPDGELATGIHGRASEFIYTLGLVCAAAPGPAPKSDVDKVRNQSRIRNPHPVKPTLPAGTVPRIIR
jgi:hypothetical protein